MYLMCGIRPLTCSSWLTATSPKFSTHATWRFLKESLASQIMQPSAHSKQRSQNAACAAFDLAQSFSCRPCFLTTFWPNTRSAWLCPVHLPAMLSTGLSGGTFCPPGSALPLHLPALFFADHAIQLQRLVRERLLI